MRRLPPPISDKMASFATRPARRLPAPPGAHKEVDAAFRGQPEFKTNAGFFGNNELENGLRLAGSSFLDVLHDVGNGTFCIFDIKTGISGL